MSAAKSLKSRSFSLDELAEVFFSTAQTSRAVHTAVRAGRARQLARGLYTKDLGRPLEAVARQHWSTIAAGYFPGAVIVDRTALEFGPAEDGSVTLAADKRRDTEVPGLRLRARQGAGPLKADVRWMGENLFMSSRPRAFLENMRASRQRRGVSRTLSRVELEQKLDDYAGGREENLRRLRDEARAVGEELAAQQEFEALDELIGAMLGTRPGELRSARARARGAGFPYDSKRLVRLGQLHQHLIATALPALDANGAHERSTFAFYEAYFSNFIEGTEFTLEQAERIVFEGVVPKQRPKDAHDILGTYHLVADPHERGRVPSSGDDLVEILRSQHALLMSERPEIGPGEWKEEQNRAGGTYFAAPELVEGTLREGFKLYDSLPSGFARACFVMFLVAEVHPFTDGNGRAARVLMNSELTAADEQRIIVPTSARDDYLYALRGMTHNANARSLVAVLTALQAESRDVDFSSRRDAELELHRRKAFDEPSAQAGVLGSGVAGAG